MLLIVCLFFFRSYALSDNYKASHSRNHPKVLKTYGDMTIALPPDPYDLCGKSSITLTLTAPGATSVIWYKDDVVIPNETSFQLTITETGRYKAKSDNTNMSNTVTIFMSQKPTKPTITFTE